MSQGAFLDAFYTTNGGEVCRIRIQPETAALVVQGNTNTIPSGTNATNEYANVASRGRRGVNARKVGVRFTGTPPTGYKAGSTIYIPWMNPATFPDPRGDKEATYLSAPAEFVGVSPERIKGG